MGLAARRALSEIASAICPPKVAPSEFEFGHRVFPDDAPRNQPKHHQPPDAFQQEEHESCNTDGLQPLREDLHGAKGKGVPIQRWSRNTLDSAYNTASPETRTCSGNT